MAIEDAAVLGNLFSRISHFSQIKPLLYAYENLRLQRTADTQASARLNQRIFHMIDGPEQQERDRLMKEAMQMELKTLRGEHIETQLEGSPNQWADKKKNRALFSYDADTVVERWWAEVGKKEIGTLAQASEARL